MAYLQSTDIKSHGDLKSSKCLVDSHWMLKIADYGLNTFKEKQTKTYPSELEVKEFVVFVWKLGIF